MSKLRRPIRWFLPCLAVLLGSCQKAPPPASAHGRIVIQYWENWTGFEADAMRAVVDDFNASQDRITVVYTSVNGLDRKLMLATAGGVPPDVAGLYSQNVPVYSENNALTPLDKVAAQAGVRREDYIDVFWQMCSHRGHLWGLPTTPSTIALIYNKKLFREAGLDPDRPPRTIAELEADNLKLTKYRPDGSLQVLGHMPEEPGWWDSLWGYWFGASMWDGKSRITANSPENLAAGRWLQSYPERFGAAHLLKFGSGLGVYASPQNAFFSGRVAMELQGVWIYNFIKNYAPADFEWGVAPFPGVSEQLHDTCIVECNVLSIPAGSAHPKEAFEFMRYVNAQGPMEKLCLGQLKFSPLQKCSDEFFAKHPNPCIRQFLDLAKSPNARYLPRVTTWTEYNNDMRVAVGLILSGKASAEEALNAVQARQQEIFDRHEARWERLSKILTRQWEQP